MQYTSSRQVHYTDELRMFPKTEKTNQTGIFRNILQIFLPLKIQMFSTLIPQAKPKTSIFTKYIKNKTFTGLPSGANTLVQPVKEATLI